MPKISFLVAVLLLMVAILADTSEIIIDLLHLIPAIGNAAAVLVNWIASILFAFFFYICFKLLNVSFVDAKRAIRFFGSFFAELIPIVDSLPWWTIGIILTVLSVWVEERMQRSTGLDVALNSKLAMNSKRPEVKNLATNTARRVGGETGRGASSTIKSVGRRVIR
jgi:hypothetical protein